MGKLNARIRRRGAKHRAGFTLVECMVGMTVMLVALMASLMSQLAASNLLRASRETNQAVMDLKACMDEILVQPPASLPAPGTPYADDTVIAAYTNLHLPGEQIRVDYPGYVAGGAVPNPLSIVLTMTWNDYAGRERTLTLSSMKTQ
ncbi:MAG: prepilin-type N-terminal cleavage/methylation domain-containing protein [Planctomycetes bacterium]|nr:prepilin-type N-terminal cleavage/methylation domain-containing protein [Planctomycetota bacterium]